MAEKASVRVVVRLRPMNEEEMKTGVTPVISASEEHKTISVMKGDDMSRTIFSFNNVFSEFATQKEVFDGTLSPMINDVLHGFESTVFAYGQTGTGKTHTMEGNLVDPIKFGIIPRSTDAIFRALKETNYDSYKVTVSYLEIYNEDLRDLLVETNSTKLEIMNNKSGTFCRGLTEKEVSSSDDVLTLMHQAVQSKQIGETKMNKHSSRSHCIFTVNVQTIVIEGEGKVQHLGKLHMVDLAGSENAKTAGIGSRKSATGSARERERLNINRSLLTLGRVIAAVKDASNGKKNIRIPYRDSKLTRILQEALGGRTKTLIIATVSPAQGALSESISTLNYAQSANGITNKPISSSYNHMPSRSTNQPFVDPTGAVEQWFELECKLKYMEAQIEEAKVALSRKEQQQQRTNDRAEKAEHALNEMEWKNEELQNRLTSLQDALDKETNRGDLLTMQLQNTEETLKQTSGTLKETEENLQQSQQKVAELEGLLDNQTKKSESLTTQLHDTDTTLNKTCAVLKSTEESLETSEQKVAMLTDNLEKSTKKCEALTDKLQKTEETLQKTARVLKSTQMKLDSSQQKVAQLEDSLEAEVKKCESLTSKLQKTEDNLMKTSEILLVTRQTEQKLNSEANSLIEAMKKSIHDGDMLYNRLLEARDADVQRRSATKNFNDTTVNILENISTKINVMTDDEGKFREKIKQNSCERHENDKEAVEQSLAAMQDINTYVQTLTNAIKSSSLNDDGVLPTFSALSQSFRHGLTEVKSNIERGENLLSNSLAKSCEKLQQYSQEMSSLNQIFIDSSETLQSEISMSGNETRDQVLKMASVVKDSITAVSNANSKTRQDLSDVIKELHQESIKATKDSGRLALKQHSKLSKAMDTFTEKMKVNEKLQEELSEEFNFVTSEGAKTLEDLSSQSVMLTLQKQAFADAKERQKKMRANILTTVMQGVQDLLTSEMNKLSQENEKQFGAFNTDTEKISELNGNINGLTRSIISHVEDRNKSAIEHASELHKSNEDFIVVSKQTDDTLVEIKEIMRKHHGFLSEGAKQTNEKMSSLEDLDLPIQNTIEKLDADTEGIEAYLADSVILAFTEGVQNLNELEANKMDFLSEKILPDATSALRELSAEQNKVHTDLISKVENIQEDADNGHTKVQQSIMNQCGQVDELQNSINSKCIDYEETVAGKRRRDIESRHAMLLENIENHYEVVTGQFSETKSLVTQADGFIDDFAKNVICTEEEVPEVEQRNIIPYSERLSSTPTDDKIIRSIGKFSSNPADEEVVTPSSPTPESAQQTAKLRAQQGTPATVSTYVDEHEIQGDDEQREAESSVDMQEQIRVE